MQPPLNLLKWPSSNHRNKGSFKIRKAKEDPGTNITKSLQHTAPVLRSGDLLQLREI